MYRRRVLHDKRPINGPKPPFRPKPSRKFSHPRPRPRLRAPLPFLPIILYRRFPFPFFLPKNKKTQRQPDIFRINACPFYFVVAYFPQGSKGCAPVSSCKIDIDTTYKFLVSSGRYDNHGCESINKLLVDSTRVVW